MSVLQRCDLERRLVAGGARGAREQALRAAMFTFATALTMAACGRNVDERWREHDGGATDGATSTDGGAKSDGSASDGGRRTTAVCRLLTAFRRRTPDSTRVTYSHRELPMDAGSD
ncbi:MAG: hypothetical protein U0235_11585 [Polyangiaceae bacterium]